MKEPSACVSVVAAKSPLCKGALLLCPAAIILTFTPESGGDTDPSRYSPIRPVIVGIVAWQPSTVTDTCHQFKQKK